MQRELKISGLQTSLIITVYAAVSIFCIPVAGYLSDRFGRKRIINIGLSIVAAGGLVSGLAACALVCSVPALFTIKPRSTSSPTDKPLTRKGNAHSPRKA
ncbi:MFS transporter [Paenibacillus sp. GCM10023250]|uniref:MFS transporter n=1 Tax=Paenibacillus sp. GCM10023250 TaxID=3252648 RepID=UPI00360B54DC